MPSLTTTLTTSTAGAVSPPIDVSLVTGEWTARITAMVSAGTSALLAVQESCDGFSSDVRTIAVFDARAGSAPATIQAPPVRAYERSSHRAGVVGARWRINVQALSSGGTVTANAGVEY